MDNAAKFEDGGSYWIPTPGSKVRFKRGKELSEGTATISHVDVATKTIYFTSPMPAGVKAGDMLVEGGK